jgi:hypothetical protein
MGELGAIGFLYQNFRIDQFPGVRMGGPIRCWILACIFLSIPKKTGPKNSAMTASTTVVMMKLI